MTDAPFESCRSVTLQHFVRDATLFKWIREVRVPEPLQEVVLVDHGNPKRATQQICNCRLANSWEPGHRNQHDCHGLLYHAREACRAGRR
jgi:hypothetical protein